MNVLLRFFPQGGGGCAPDGKTSHKANHCDIFIPYMITGDVTAMQETTIIHPPRLSNQMCIYTKKAASRYFPGRLEDIVSENYSVTDSTVVSDAAAAGCS